MQQKVMNTIVYVQITIFIKAILESPYKALLGPYIFMAPMWPQCDLSSFLTAIQF